MLADLINDPSWQQALNRAILLWALVTARVVPIVQVVPYMGGKALPQTVKLGLAVALTAMIYPAMAATGAADQLPDGALAWITLLIKEVLLGVMFGFVAGLVFESIIMAGQLIDNARGQTMATALVPQLPERVSVSADYMYQMAAVMFVLLGGHRVFLAALTGSFVAIPPHVIPDFGPSLEALTLSILRLGADAITLGVMLAFPVTATVLLTDVCLALVNRAAPQINVFFLGMPLKAMIGIAVMMIALEVMMGRVMDDGIDHLGWLIQTMDALSAFSTK